LDGDESWISLGYMIISSQKILGYYTLARLLEDDISSKRYQVKVVYNPIFDPGTSVIGIKIKI